MNANGGNVSASFSQVVASCLSGRSVSESSRKGHFDLGAGVTSQLDLFRGEQSGISLVHEAPRATKSSPAQRSYTPPGVNGEFLPFGNGALRGCQRHKSCGALHRLDDCGYHHPGCSRFGQPWRHCLGHQRDLHNRRTLRAGGWSDQSCCPR